MVKEEQEASDLLCDDWSLAQDALCGSDDAAKKIIFLCRPYVLGAMEQICIGDSQSAEKAREIVADLFADCFGANSKRSDGRRLLELYGGRGSLRSWLIVCARSRLRNWWRSAEKRTSISLDGMVDGGAGEGTSFEDLSRLADLADADVALLLREALSGSFCSLPPRQLVFLRLVFLYGIKRERLAEIWQLHPSNVGRQIGEALNSLRSGTLSRLKRLDPWIQITWEDCLEVCREGVSMLYGSEE